MMVEVWVINEGRCKKENATERIPEKSKCDHRAATHVYNLMDEHGDAVIEQGRRDREGDIENPGGGNVSRIVHPIDLPYIEIIEVEFGGVGPSVSVNEHTDGPASNKVDPINKWIVLE